MKDYKYFLNDQLGGVKTEKMKTVRFAGRRVEASDVTRLQRKSGTVSSLCCLPKAIVY